MVAPSNTNSTEFRSTLPPGEERLLLETVAGGDRTAFCRLYTIYLPVVHQYIAKSLDFSHPDVEEVAQEIFFKIWKKKETLIVIRHFDKFLFTVARNSLTDHFRSRKAGQIRSRVLADNWVPAQYPAEEKVMTLEYLALTEKALGQMPERRRKSWPRWTSGTRNGWCSKKTSWMWMPVCWIVTGTGWSSGCQRPRSSSIPI